MTKPTQLVISEQAREAAEQALHIVTICGAQNSYAIHDRIAEHFQLLLNSQREAIIRECAGIVHDEPNLPGEMPDDFYASVCSSKDMATTMFRSTVDVTMDNIKKRILAKIQNK